MSIHPTHSQAAMFAEAAAESPDFVPYVCSCGGDGCQACGGSGEVWVHIDAFARR